MLCSMRGTETAKVEGLWLVNTPKCIVSEDPDDSPEIQLFSLYSSLPSIAWEILWCHFMTSQLSALIFQWENHCACTLEMLPFICTYAGIHTRTPINYKCIWTSPSFPWPNFPCLWHSLWVFWCASYWSLNYLHILNKTQANIMNKQGWWMEHID